MRQIDGDDGFGDPSDAEEGSFDSINPKVVAPLDSESDFGDYNAKTEIDKLMSRLKKAVPVPTGQIDTMRRRSYQQRNHFASQRSGMLARPPPPRLSRKFTSDVMR